MASSRLRLTANSVRAFRYVEDLAFVIDGTRQIHPLAGDGNDVAAGVSRKDGWPDRPRTSRRVGMPRPPIRSWWSATIPRPASAASTCCVGASSRSGPKISRSALRTSTRRLRGSRTGRPSERHSNGVAAWSRSMTFTSGRRPRKAVYRQISFSTKHYRSSIGTSHGVKSGKTFRALHVNP
jgi:hypothetical protein